LLQDPPPPPPAQPPAGAPAAAAPPRNPAAGRVTTLKQDFARLTLGMFAASFSAYPMTFSYAGEAEAPQGKADVVDAKGPNNFTLRLFIAKDTHLPVMVSWTAPTPMRGGPGRGGPPGAAPGAAPGVPPGAGRGAPPPPAGATPPPAGGAPQQPSQPSQPGQPPPAPPQNYLYFGEYHDVDGMQFPFRLRRAVGADTIEETTFDRFKVNAKIDPKRFEVRK